LKSLANIENVIGNRQHNGNDPDILNFLRSPAMYGIGRNPPIRMKIVTGLSEVQ
jgi:hypothetical protein